MIYLDYSATTPAHAQVLKKYTENNIKYFANANSMHRLGKEANRLLSNTIQQIHQLLELDENQELIFTSGATEANNLAIKGCLVPYKNQNKHIITTRLEHPSLIAPLNYMQNKGFIVDIVDVDKNGVIDLEHFKKLLTKEVVLVAISSVNSEIGVRQPLAAIKDLIRPYDCILLCDATQSIGKEKIDLKGIDLISLSAHKFYGLKGVGLLIRNRDVALEPLIMGGKSTSALRAGTPPLPLMISLLDALKIAYQNFDNKAAHVLKMNQYLRSKLKDFPTIVIHGDEQGLPHIINISLLGKSSQDTVALFSKNNIYLSTHTACSSEERLSQGIMAMTHNEDLATSSIRISLSYLTTQGEIDFLVQVMKEATSL